jgi:hypothetical protein
MWMVIWLLTARVGNRTLNELRFLGTSRPVVDDCMEGLSISLQPPVLPLSKRVWVYIVKMGFLSLG